MANYGTAAVKAVEGINARDVNGNPVKAWEKAVRELGFSEASQRKGCPKSAFLGLCEEGYVAGIERGAYTKSKKNKAYGIHAVILLKQQPQLANNPSLLWEKVRLQVENAAQNQNGQMDVVIALWKNGLIKK